MKKAKNEKNIKQILAVTAILIILIAMEMWIAWSAGFVQSKEPLEYTMNNIEVVDQCEGSANKFVMTGEDPKIIWNQTDKPIRTITLNFAEPLTADAAFELYYGKNFSFDQKHTYNTTLQAGISQYVISLQGGEYNTIRTDINADYTLQNIMIETKERSNGRVTLLAVLFLIFDAVCVVVYQKMIRKNMVNIQGWYTKHRLTIPQLFVLWGAIGGLTVSILVPAGQVPDEWAHVVMMDGEWGLSGYADSTQSTLNDAIQLDDVHEVYGRKIESEDYLAAMKIHYAKGLSKTVHPHILAIRHITASVGYLMGIFLNLPIMWCLQIAEFTALAGYLICGYYALKWMPVKKEFMMFIMLLPMTLQQAASLNYDSMAFGISFLLIAYLLHLKYKAETIEWKNLLAVCIMAMILLITKLPYACLALLAFTVPHEKYNFKIGRFDIGHVVYKFRYILLALAAVLVAVVAVMVQSSLYLNAFKAAIVKFPTFIRLIINSFRTRGVWYMGGILGCLGWIDTPLNGVQYLVICLMAVWLSQAGKKEAVVAAEKGSSTIKNRVALFGIILLIFLLIFASMLSWTTMVYEWETPQTLQQWKESLMNMDNIYGVQGRYFLPCLPLAALVVRDIIPIPSKGVQAGLRVYCLVGWISLTITLLARYWMLL